MNETNSNLEFRKLRSLKYLYEVNENGTIIRNVKSKKQLKIKLDMHHSDTGYYTTFVHLGGRGPNSRIVRVPIHRAVAEAWHGECPPGLEVDHIDRNSRNNDWRNLRYVTRSEQMKNRDHTGIAARGAAKLEQARQERAKPVILTSTSGEAKAFTSIAECARYLGEQTGHPSENARYRLKAKRSHIYGFDVEYPPKCRD